MQRNQALQTLLLMMSLGTFLAYGQFGHADTCVGDVDGKGINEIALGSSLQPPSTPFVCSVDIFESNPDLAFVFNGRQFLIAYHSAVPDHRLFSA